MVIINNLSYDIKITKGDNATLIFSFNHEDGEEYNINDDIIILGIKDIDTDEILLEMEGTKISDNEVEFKMEWSKLRDAGLDIGTYYYDMFFKSDRYTPFQEANFIIMEVSHNVEY